MSLIDEPRPAEPTRLKLTWDMLDRMHETGILPDKTPLELRDGELVLMPAEGERHFDVKSKVIRSLLRAAPDRFQIGVDGPLRLTPIEGPEPDAFVAIGVAGPARAKGADIVLVIEVSDSSLAYDLGEKAQKYAAGGVAEYWVIDIVNQVVHLHAQKVGDSWAPPRKVSKDDAISPSAMPEWTFRLADVL